MSKLLLIKVMCIRARYHFITIIMTNVEKLDDTKKNEYKLLTVLGRVFWQYVAKLKTHTCSNRGSPGT
jgi:hypothetical protein